MMLLYLTRQMKIIEINIIIDSRKELHLTNEIAIPSHKSLSVHNMFSTISQFSFFPVIPFDLRKKTVLGD